MISVYPFMLCLSDCRRMMRRVKKRTMWTSHQHRQIQIILQSQQRGQTGGRVVRLSSSVSADLHLLRINISHLKRGNNYWYNIQFS